MSRGRRAGSGHSPLPTRRSALSTPPTFHCEFRPDGDVVLVRPVGELDMATVPVLEARLAELRAEGYRALVLDLGGLGFMDSTGIALVVRWDLEAQDDGFAFSLLPGSERVQRLFELTGLAGRLPFGVPADG